MDPFTLMLIGTGLQIGGQFASNFANSAQQKINEDFFNEQAEYAFLAGERKLQIAEFNYGQVVGQQVSKFAGGGVALEGSAEVTVGGTMSNFINEAYAIKRDQEMNFKLAKLRAKQAGSVADTQRSAGFNMLQAGSTVMQSGLFSGAPASATTTSSVPDLSNLQPAYTIA